MRRSRAAAAMAITMLAALFAGCGGGPTPTNPELPPSFSASSFNPLADPQRVPALIREHLGESPELRRLILADTYMSMEVRDPVKRDNIDTYRYSDGEWETSPVSVSMSEIEEFDDVTFTLGQIAWDKIPGLIQQAKDGLELEQESVSSVSFDKLAGDPPRIYIPVNGLRGNGRLIANADGTDIEVRRN